MSRWRAIEVGRIRRRRPVESAEFGRVPVELAVSFCWNLTLGQLQRARTIQVLLSFELRYRPGCMWDGSMMTSVRPDAVPTLNAGPFRFVRSATTTSRWYWPQVGTLSSLRSPRFRPRRPRVRPGTGSRCSTRGCATASAIPSSSLRAPPMSRSARSGSGSTRSGPDVPASGWVLDAHRRRRVVSCALSAIATWGFTLPGIVRLELYVEPWNKGSWRTAEHAGFYREGLLRSWEPVGNKRRDMYMYSRLATDPT
ncbi:MAG: GCN5-related N-acetyltransferase [Pseudonocardiales bacterium]|jgi:hypothetical protein|nr:GCN5-related N-acetyltransferase [Pseudonocardiales bacterium]